MREIQASTITDVVEKLCIEANYHLPEDVKCAITGCRACEDGEIAKGVLDKIVENYEIADAQNVPICQDTGMACVFLEIGQDVHIAGGDLAEAVNEGVRRGYDKGYLRKSVVKDPVRRGNTGDNTPAMLYTEIVPGDQIKVTVGPKGFGSENMSMIRMFKPSAGLQGIKDFILEVVETAGPNPCPPMVVGVGIGGTFDKCALLAKKALMRPIDSENPDPFYADLEKEMLEKVNKLGISSNACSVVCKYSILESLPSCHQCVYQPYCGVCPVISYAAFHDVTEKYPNHYRCAVYKGILDVLFELIQSEENRKIFLSWIEE